MKQKKLAVARAFTIMSSLPEDHGEFREVISSLPLFKKIIEASGFDIDYRDSQQNTLFHRLASYRSQHFSGNPSVEALGLLLDEYPLYDLSCVNVGGYTPLMLAVRSMKFDAMQLLLNHIAKHDDSEQSEMKKQFSLKDKNKHVVGCHMGNPLMFLEFLKRGGDIDPQNLSCTCLTMLTRAFMYAWTNTKTIITSKWATADGLREMFFKTNLTRAFKVCRGRRELENQMRWYLPKVVLVNLLSQKNKNLKRVMRPEIVRMLAEFVWGYCLYV